MTVSDVKFSPKRPQDIEIFQIDFVRLVPVGDTIVSANVVASVKTGKGTAAGMVTGIATWSGTKVQQRIQLGTNGTTYDLRFIITTALGLHWEVIGELLVRE
jgi:hypothetical protein